MTDLFLLRPRDKDFHASLVLPFVDHRLAKNGEDRSHWWRVARPRHYAQQRALGHLYAAAFCSALDQGLEPAMLWKLAVDMGPPALHGALEISFFEWIAAAAQRGART